MFGLRIDIDTIACLRHGVPNLLRVLDKHGIKASFFCPMGWEGDLLSVLVHRFIRSRKGLSREGVAAPKGVRTRPNLREGLALANTLLLAPKFLKEIDVLNAILAEGHDLGVHGYVHARWRCPTPRELANEFERMVGRYTATFGAPPAGLAAPLFQNNDSMLRLCDRFGFEYVSALPGQKPFHPKVNGVSLKHVQIPITLDPIHDGRILPVLFYGAKIGLSKKEMVQRAMARFEGLAAQNIALKTMHIHPKDEGIHLLEAFDELMGLIRESGVPCRTFAEIADMNGWE